MTGSGGQVPGFNTHTPTRVQLVSISYVKVVNSNQLNEARLGWNRFAEGFFPEDQSFNPTSIGLNTGVPAYDCGLPVISVGGFSGLGASSSVPRNRVDANWHFIDNYSWKSGKHDIKFGYEFRRTTIMQLLDHNFRGTSELWLDSRFESAEPEWFPDSARSLPGRRARMMELRSRATPCGILRRTATASTCRTASAGRRA